MEFLKSLGIKDFNPGAYLGNGQWSTTTDAGVKEAINPSTGEVIARVYAASADDYEGVAPGAGTTARRRNPLVYRSSAEA
jgi:aldehyde dehydrogenase (NAD+)